MSVIKEIKNQMKELASEVREAKNNFKTIQRELSTNVNTELSYRDKWTAYSKKESLKDDFRHKHIARCLLKGKSYKQVEIKCRYENAPSDQDINRYIHEFSALMNHDEYPVYARQLVGDSEWDLEHVDTLPVNHKLKTKLFEERRDRLIAEIANQQELEEAVMEAR